MRKTLLAASAIATLAFSPVAALAQSQQSAGQSGATTSSPGTTPSNTSGKPGLLIASVDHTKSMEGLLDAAQKLRESIQALAQQPPGPKRSTAIEAARDALLLTQRAMLQLPAELRVEGKDVHAATAWPKAMARLDDAARSLRESVQAMTAQTAGERRNAAMATARAAMLEAEQAMLALPDFETTK